MKQKNVRKVHDHICERSFSAFQLLLRCSKTCTFTNANKVRNQMILKGFQKVEEELSKRVSDYIIEEGFMKLNAFPNTFKLFSRETT